MSFKSRKRRVQRLRHIEKIAWWKDYRQLQSDRAFQKWKLIHVDQIRKEYLEGCN